MGFYKFREAVKKCVSHAQLREQNSRVKELRAKLAETNALKKSDRIAALQNPVHEIPDTVQVTEAYLDDVQRRLYFNDDFADYYIRLGDETNLQKHYNTADSIRNCSKHWFGDWYALRRVFDRKSLSLCHNMFCSNCNHLRQASRIKRLTPVLENYQKTHDLYHCVITIPNCSGNKLDITLDNFFALARQVTRYLRGDAKIAGIDFLQLGYIGGIRCLEIVVNEKTYHPHFHFVFILKKGLNLIKRHINKFSYNRKQPNLPPRKFSDFEILLQKIAYLAYNNHKVNLASINSVKLGYSCMLDMIEGDEWHEVLKYVTKLTKDTMCALDYTQFKTLYFALYKKHRAYQCLGVLSRLGKDDSIDSEVVEEYRRIIAELQLYEDPVSSHYELDSLISNVKNGSMRIISKYIIQQLLNKEAERNA